MKKIIALLTGGTTNEASVSLKSADTISKNLDASKYEVYKIVVDNTGWYYENQDSTKIAIDKNDFSLTISGKKIKFDGVFIIIHGSPGEDGKLQGYFDMIGLPYTTCNAVTSAVTMNKAYTKDLVTSIPHLHVAKSVQIFKSENHQLQQLTSTLKLPYFIKPNNGGSSIGMSKVKQAGDLQTAIDKAFAEDDQILIEEFVEGREFSVGVFRADGKVVVLPATEVIPKNEFFDFEAKYTPGATEEITPARMTEEEKKRVQQIVTDVYIRLDCRGVVRIDYFLEKNTGNFYFIEINTIPGQTATSFIPQQVASYGLSLQSFYTKIIEETLSKVN